MSYDVGSVFEALSSDAGAKKHELKLTFAGIEAFEKECGSIYAFILSATDSEKFKEIPFTQIRKIILVGLCGGGMAVVEAEKEIAKLSIKETLRLRDIAIACVCAAFFDQAPNEDKKKAQKK